MASFSSRVVAQITEERDGLQKVRFDDGSDGYALVSVCGTLEAGDEVVVNTTAVDLGLGTGGYHVVHWIANKRSQPTLRSGEILKARYLSEQIEVDPYVAVGQDLSGARVLLCALHSQLGAVAVGLNSENLGYVMTDQAALPLALSDLLADLKRAGVVRLTATAGQAFGGDLEVINVASGVAALLDHNCNQIVVAAGPGHVGTASDLGFSSLELAGHAAILSALGARVGICVRASELDSRERHQGISHHMESILRATPTEIEVPIPLGTQSDWITALNHRPCPVNPVDVIDALQKSNIAVTTMGRSLELDALACSYVGASVSWLLGRDK